MGIATIIATFIAISAAFMTERGETYEENLKNRLRDFNKEITNYNNKLRSNYNRGNFNKTSLKELLETKDNLVADFKFYVSLHNSYSDFLKRRKIFSKSFEFLFGGFSFCIAVTFSFVVMLVLKEETKLTELFLNDMNFLVMVIIVIILLAVLIYDILKSSSYVELLTMLISDSLPSETELLTPNMKIKTYPELPLNIFLAFSCFKKKQLDKEEVYQFETCLNFNIAFQYENHKNRDKNNNPVLEYVKLFKVIEDSVKYILRFKFKPAPTKIIIKLENQGVEDEDDYFKVNIYYLFSELSNNETLFAQNSLGSFSHLATNIPILSYDNDIEKPCEYNLDLSSLIEKRKEDSNKSDLTMM